MNIQKERISKLHNSSQCSLTSESDRNGSSLPKSNILLEKRPQSNGQTTKVTQFSVASKRKKPSDSDPDFVVRSSRSKTSSRIEDNDDEDDIQSVAIYDDDDDDNDLQTRKANTNSSSLSTMVIKREQVDDENLNFQENETAGEYDESRLRSINNRIPNPQGLILIFKIQLFSLLFKNDLFLLEKRTTHK